MKNTVEIETVDRWREYLAQQRLEQSPSREERVARILLRLSSGVHPSKKLAREIVQLQHFDWVFSVLPDIYTAVTGTPCDMAEFMPSAEELEKLRPITKGKRNRRKPTSFERPLTQLSRYQAAA